MIRYSSAAAAEAALGRGMTWAEAAWFRYSAATPDYCLYCHNILILVLVYTLAPLPLALLELRAPAKLTWQYKLQPRVRLSPAAFLRCYKDTARVLLLTVGALQLVSYPAVKVAVYFLVEDYLGYWIHRLLHTEWGYSKIHHVHHEYAAPMGFAAPYAHWAEVILLGFPAFAGPAIVPCHMTTFWLWFVIRHIEAIDTHSGFDFPFNPTRFIPFYGGAQYHDYHHYVGRRSQSNFASVFTICDYVYGTDKGYRYHKAASLAKLNNDTVNCNEEKGRDASSGGKQD